MLRIDPLGTLTYMSTTHTSDGRRLSSMAHAQHTFMCTCGKIVSGNGGKSGHRRACDGRWLSSSEAYDLRLAAWNESQGRSAMRQPTTPTRRGMKCGECGQHLDRSNEFHPFLYCLLFKNGITDQKKYLRESGFVRIAKLSPR